MCRHRTGILASVHILSSARESSRFVLSSFCSPVLACGPAADPCSATGRDENLVLLIRIPGFGHLTGSFSLFLNRCLLTECVSQLLGLSTFPSGECCALWYFGTTSTNTALPFGQAASAFSLKTIYSGLCPEARSVVPRLIISSGCALIHSRLLCCFGT